MATDITNLLPIERTHTLAETWAAWKGGRLVVAFLGDGSQIKAVGRPHQWVCEVHSDRGVESRRSDEGVLWRPSDADGKWEPGPSI